VTAGYSGPMRALELFSGIGGFHAAADGVEVVGAVDHDRAAADTYTENHGLPTLVTNLASVPVRRLAAFEADLWWMSPPCQPHTIRGHQKDLDDPRSEPFVAMVRAIEEVRPSFLALENVPWFQSSKSHALLRETLDRCGYDVQELLLCPSDLGWPNQRLRFYLVAGKGLRPFPPKVWRHVALPPFVDADAPADLDIGDTLRERFGGALHVVRADDDDAVACCFTAAYGNSPVYAGSYVRQGERLRYFSPEEIGAFLGFPERLRFPEGLGRKKRWRLVGNSVSVVAVRHVLTAIPGALADEESVSDGLPRASAR
jgi:DNA (cytosine-5)-methyltransferase 1